MEIQDIEIPDLTVKENAEQPLLDEIVWPPDFSAFSVLGKIEEIPQAQRYEDRYPEIKENGSVSFSFQYNNQTFILLVFANKISERLYYSIYDSYNTRILCNQTLTDYPVNLNLTDSLGNSQILFYNNTIYYKEFVVE